MVHALKYAVHFSWEIKKLTKPYKKFEPSVTSIILIFFANYEKYGTLPINPKLFRVKT